MSKICIVQYCFHTVNFRVLDCTLEYVHTVVYGYTPHTVHDNAVCSLSTKLSPFVRALLLVHSILDGVSPPFMDSVVCVY